MRGLEEKKTTRQKNPLAPRIPKINISLTGKIDPPADVQASLFQQATGQPLAPAAQEDLHITDTLKGIAKASEAANHADNLMSNKSVDDEPDTPMSKGVNNPSPSKSK